MEILEICTPASGRRRECLFPGNIPRCCGDEMSGKCILRMGFGRIEAQDIVVLGGDNFLLIENVVISGIYER